MLSIFIDKTFNSQVSYTLFILVGFEGILDLDWNRTNTAFFPVPLCIFAYLYPKAHYHGKGEKGL